MFYLACGYLVLFIIRPFENWRFLGSLHVERIYGILVFAGLLVSRKRRNLLCPQTVAVLAVLGAVAISSIFAYRRELAWVFLYKYCTLVAFYVVVLATIENETQLRTFVVVYICAVAAYQVLTLREYLVFGRGVWAGGMWRMRGFDNTFGHPNSVAATIVYSMPFVFGILKEHARLRIRLALAGYVVLSMACIARTGSRSGLLGFLLVCVIYTLSLSGRQKACAVAALAIFLLIAWLSLPVEQQMRFSTLTRSLEEHQGTDRNRIRGQGLHLGLRMLQDRPLLGVGMGSFASYSRERLGAPYIYSHNLYGELLGNIGVLGTFAFACMVAITFRNALFVRGEVKKGNIAGTSPAAWITYAVVVMLVAHFFMGWASHSFYRATWLWGGALAVLAREFVKEKIVSEESDVR